MLPSRPDNTLSHPSSRHALLRVYAYYRITLSLLLLIFFHLSLLPNVLGANNLSLFNYMLSIYTVVTVITLAHLSNKQSPPSDQYMFMIYFVDIFSTSILMHTSGGISSGLGLLLLVTVCAGSITLNSTQITTLIAAIAALAVLISPLYDILSKHARIDQLLPAGLLGFLFFVTSQLFLYLTQRMRLAAEEAESQTQQRLALQHLNELIVQRMRTGIVVLSANGNIELVNESAAKLLELPLLIDSRSPLRLSFTHIPLLANCLTQWRQNPFTRIKPIKLREAGPELQLSFAGLELAENSSLLVFVEDTREMSQHAQQLKLASLGHLTANIAHEVRNPLGAISHAAQLLGESSTLGKNDQRLSEIIQNHSRRVNQIIENVLQLTGQRNSFPQKINLDDFLNSFISRYRESHRNEHQIDIDSANPNTTVNIDPSHLEQVLNNLCDNGLRYSLKATGKAHVLLRNTIDRSLGTPCLDIIDNGEGIPKENETTIFEPFFTTDNQGTGLGLYLSRELCEINQARLDYQRTPEGKSCFHISFAHPDKLSSIK